MIGWLADQAPEHLLDLVGEPSDHRSRGLLDVAFGLPGISDEELLTKLGAEAPDELLPGGRRDVVGERLCARDVDLGPLRRVHADHMVDVQEHRVALDEDVEAQLRAVGEERRVIGEGIAALLRRDLQRRPHTLPGLQVPGVARGRDPGRLPAVSYTHLTLPTIY